MWRIAAPMILSNISIPLVGITDTVITGHLENPDNFVEMKFLLLEQKYLELLYKGNSIEALKVSSSRH